MNKKILSIQNLSLKIGANKILSNISFDLNKNETLGIVGESGSGKTTLANLINRFYDVDRGQVTIDGVNLKSLSKKNLRQLVGIVTQEAILFNDTVANNICLGRPNASVEEMIQAAKIANAHNFITALPNGYQTNIGDRGGKLSGGQKQRLSIARAILKKANILILDEPTSALDSVSEKIIFDTLRNLVTTERATVLIVTHNFELARKADLVLQLKEGKVDAFGYPDDVLTNHYH